MDNRTNDISRRERRRNRLIGTALFVLLVLACRLYYEYCMHHPLAAPSAPATEASGTQPDTDEPPAVSDRSADPIPGKRTPDDEGAPPSSTIPGTWSVTGPLELPAFDSADIVIKNTQGRYTLRYDTAYRQAAWVAYTLTGEDAAPGRAKRRDRFVPDPAVVREGYPTAFTSDYKGSGYDRGHLCPSADRSRSQEENDCTFYLSNISPQTPALNRGPWKALEEQVRRWAVRHDTLYIVTGGLLAPGLERLSSGIGIPEYFYKAILTKEEDAFEAIGFLFPNATRFEGDYVDYAVSIDSLQTFTRIDFYHHLPDPVEYETEKAYSSRFWFGE